MSTNKQTTKNPLHTEARKVFCQNGIREMKNAKFWHEKKMNNKFRLIGKQIANKQKQKQQQQQHGQTEEDERSKRRISCMTKQNKRKLQNIVLCD